MTKFYSDSFSNQVKSVVTPNTQEVKSRYDNKIKLRLQDDKLIIRTLKKSDLVPDKDSRDILHYVSVSEEGRPELISSKYYNDARLYWVILSANNFREREDLKSGMTIRIPCVSSIYGSKGVLRR